jgi:hypothetical protein
MFNESQLINYPLNTITTILNVIKQLRQLVILKGIVKTHIPSIQRQI